jgi:transcriptional regulator with XRE-family HTH domain
MKNTPFAANLRFYRARAGLSQCQFAEAFGCSQKLVSTWETGNRQPNAHQIITVATLLHCEPGDLLKPISGVTEAPNAHSRRKRRAPRTAVA